MWGILLTIALAAPAPDAGEPVVELIKGGRTTRQSRELMHTRVTIAIADPPRGELASHQLDFDAAFAIFSRIDRVMNEWKDTSPLALINAGAAVQPIAAPADLCEVIKLSLDGAKKTKGLFDPTWAALREVWTFAEGAQVPDAGVVKAACKSVSWKDVELKPLKTPTPEQACTVRFKKPGMKLGLGGIVKGWGIDQAVKLLRSVGYQNFSIQAGGDQYLAGKIGDRAWKVGIREPRGPEGKTFARTEVSDVTFSTSGDYDPFFLKDGVRYHPLIDPRTCQPGRKSVSATVLAKTGVEAEILTKAAFLLGWPEGQKLAAASGAQLVLVDGDGGVHFSPELKGTLDWSQPIGFGAPDGGISEKSPAAR
jgi:thiamine biosynthesis lipoprotein